MYGDSVGEGNIPLQKVKGQLNDTIQVIQNNDSGTFIVEKALPDMVEDTYSYNYFHYFTYIIDKNSFI